MDGCSDTKLLSLLLNNNELRRRLRMRREKNEGKKDIAELTVK
jgi:hypothetical protein